MTIETPARSGFIVLVCTLQMKDVYMFVMSCYCSDVFVLFLGLVAWDGYPSLKMLMEMVMTKYVQC